MDYNRKFDNDPEILGDILEELDELMKTTNPSAVNFKVTEESISNRFSLELGGKS